MELEKKKIYKLLYRLGTCSISTQFWHNFDTILTNSKTQLVGDDIIMILIGLLGYVIIIFSQMIKRCMSQAFAFC